MILPSKYVVIRIYFCIIHRDVQESDVCVNKGTYFSYFCGTKIRVVIKAI